MLRRYGLIDFGSDIKEAAEQGLTDRVLVLVFRSFRHKWIHPIGLFASKGAANQHVLSEIIMIAIIFAAPRRCHRQGVSCKKSGRNFFEHLLDENIKTYASIDVPHLLKCTRNQFLLSSRTGTWFEVGSEAHSRPYLANDLVENDSPSCPTATFEAYNYGF
uniref:Transposable element P transposase-like RNase H domain-containing protein n=1 Tax=Daphnia galeata TaxID=27404 RepID=A0A8J2S3M8_9CRUS|nr:unnamed protein product [Daphnia galeata]